MAEGVTTVRPERFWEDLHFNSDGLVPVIVQQVDDGNVLMLAWANSEALQKTVVERRAHFWSRSRGCLWRKGDTSGNAMEVASVRWDCDADAVLYGVRASGPACHTGEMTCFFRGEQASLGEPRGKQPWVAPATISLGERLDALAGVIADRQRTMPEGSYVASLLRADPSRALQKVGEEAMEVILAGARFDAGADGHPHVVAEFADLFFHALLALAVLGVDPGEVARELERRAQVRPLRTRPGDSA